MGEHFPVRGTNTSYGMPCTSLGKYVSAGVVVGLVAGLAGVSTLDLGDLDTCVIVDGVYVLGLVEIGA